jgi:hypothetical protein
MAQDMYLSCVQAASQQGLANPDGSCACAAGYLGGALSDRDFDIASRLTRMGAMVASGASQAEIEAEVAAFQAAGYTEADASRVTQIAQAHTARGNAICAGVSGLSSV